MQTCDIITCGNFLSQRSVGIMQNENLKHKHLKLMLHMQFCQSMLVTKRLDSNEFDKFLLNL